MIQISLEMVLTVFYQLLKKIKMINRYIIPLFLFAYIIFTSCKSTCPVNEKVILNNNTIVYVNVYSPVLDYPLHASLLFDEELDTKILFDRYKNIDDLMCFMYNKGRRIFDGSSLNFAKFPPNLQDSIIINGLNAKIDNLYSKLTSNVIEFSENEGSLVLLYSEIEARYFEISNKESSSYDWLSHEYEVGDSCTQNSTTIYLIDIR